MQKVRVYWPSSCKLDIDSLECYINDRGEACHPDEGFIGYMHSTVGTSYEGQLRCYYTELAARAQLVVGIARKLKWHENKTMILTRALKKHSELLGDALNEQQPPEALAASGREP